MSLKVLCVFLCREEMQLKTYLKSYYLISLVVLTTLAIDWLLNKIK